MLPSFRVERQARQRDLGRDPRSTYWIENSSDTIDRNMLPKLEITKIFGSKFLITH